MTLRFKLNGLNDLKDFSLLMGSSFVEDLGDGDPTRTVSISARSLQDPSLFSSPLACWTSPRSKYDQGKKTRRHSYCVYVMYVSRWRAEGKVTTT